jgi:hypothetical protein
MSDEAKNSGPKKSTLPRSADPYTALLEHYLLADRKFYTDKILLSFLKAEIWAAVETGDPADIAGMLSMAVAAIESGGANIAEAAEVRHYELQAKRAQRRTEARA